MIKIKFLPRRVKRYTVVLSALIALTVFMSPFSKAADSPELIVRSLFTELLGELDRHREANTLTHDNVRDVFSKILDPRIDYEALSIWILKDRWTNASTEQKNQFTQAFQAYIINTYSLALAGGENISMDVRDEPQRRNKAAIVTADFAIADADPIPIDFRLVEKDGKWVLFDVSFAGVSLAVTFRSDFNYIARDGGIDAVTRYLNHRAEGNTGRIDP